MFCSIKRQTGNTSRLKRYAFGYVWTWISVKMSAECLVVWICGGLLPQQPACSPLADEQGWLTRLWPRGTNSSGADRWGMLLTMAARSGDATQRLFNGKHLSPFLRCPTHVLSLLWQLSFWIRKHLKLKQPHSKQEKLCRSVFGFWESVLM